MTDTSKLFELGQLAEASYANFSGTDDVRVKLLEGVDTKSLLSQSQANEFATHWQVASHQLDTTNGFSATLFQRVDDDPIGGFHAGEYVYAIRGTVQNKGI